MENRNTMPESRVNKEAEIVSYYTHNGLGVTEIVVETGRDTREVAAVLVQSDTTIVQESFRIVPSKMNYTNRL